MNIPSRSTTDRQEPRRQRFSGPWSRNPWLNWSSIGPQNHRGVDRLQADRFSASRPLSALAPAMVEPGAAQVKRKKDKRQQRTALSTWEGEGGKNN